MFDLTKIFAQNQSEDTDSSDSDITDFLGSEGAEAIVDEIIEGPGKKGRVYFQGTWWPAVCELDVVLNPGDVVNVVGIDRITLMVEPLKESS